MANNLVKLLFGAVILAAFSCGVAAAAESVPVALDIKLKADRIFKKWPAVEREAARAKSRKVLAEYLTEFFPYWNFRHDRDMAKRSVKVSIFEPIPNVIWVSVETFSDNRRDRYWEIQWFNPGDASQHPTVDDLPEKLREFFERFVITKYKEKIEIWLQSNVPVASKGVWLALTDPDRGYQIVLSLPFDRYSALSYSIFDIKGKPAHGPQESLEAVGIGERFLFPSQTPSYDGLVVLALRKSIADQDPEPLNDQIAPQVRKLQLGPIYLKKEKKRHDVALFEEDSS